MSSGETAAIIFDPGRLTQARRLRGLLKTELAARVDVTPAAITQFEAGDFKPAPATLRRLAQALQMPIEYFGRGREQFFVNEVDANFRSLRSTSKKERSQASAQLELLAELVHLVERHIELPEVDIPFEVNMAPESAADAVREAWGLGTGPISDVVGLLERHGAIVARLQADSERVDAFSCRIKERPYVLLAANKDTADRSRFDAAHELGHLVLHYEAAPGIGDAEVDAHRFASAFLMPRVAIRPELPRRVDWDRLLDLKLRWRVSLQALLRRGRDLGIYSEPTYRRAYQSIARRGWRTREPGEVGPAETPQLMQKATQMLTERFGSGLELLAAQTQLPAAEIERLLSMFRDHPARVELPRTDDELRRSLAIKLSPQRFPSIAGNLAAVIGYILDEPYAAPAVTQIVVSSDGLVRAEVEGGGTTRMIGEQAELNRHLIGLLTATPDLTPDEIALFGRLQRKRIKR